MAAAGSAWRMMRRAAPGLLAGALCACASSPAPISARGGPFAPSPIDPSAAPRVANGAARLQCVPYARQISGIAIYGDAVTWWGQAAGRYPRSSLPAPGAVLVLKGFADATRGHVAVVTAMISAREIRVDQANWLNNGEISVSVPVLDVSPNNDWSEVRVWHIPGGHWGGRVYLAEGFIHPFPLAPIS